MYVTQTLACSVQNSATPLTPAQLAASAARTATQDRQMDALLQKWITMLDRTPESFKALNIAPSEFVQPQSAAQILNLAGGKSAADTVAAYRAGDQCNPVKDGPAVVPLNGTLGTLPDSEPVNLLAKGPLGRPQGTGLEGYRDMQPFVQAQRIAARRRRSQLYGNAARVEHAHKGVGCHCGGTCGHCGDGIGDFTGTGSGVLWGSLAAAGFLMWATLGKKRR